MELMVGGTRARAGRRPTLSAVTAGTRAVVTGEGGSSLQGGGDLRAVHKPSVRECSARV